MKTATIELSHEEIATAIAEYVERDGWKCQGTVKVTHHAGYSDQRDQTSTPDTVTAKVQVSR